MSDYGLLAPMWAATATATSDDVYVAAILDAESALARAGARIGLVPAEAAEAIAAACAAEFDASGIAARATVDYNGPGKDRIVFYRSI
jgi:3-carboxy-cis,cis-muconate cycloisomerase